MEEDYRVHKQMVLTTDATLDQVLDVIREEWFNALKYEEAKNGRDAHEAPLNNGGYKFELTQTVFSAGAGFPLGSAVTIVKAHSDIGATVVTIGARSELWPKNRTAATTEKAETVTRESLSQLAECLNAALVGRGYRAQTKQGGAPRRATFANELDWGR